MIELAQAEPDDLRWVADHMRAIEIDECAATGRTPLEALEAAASGSRGASVARWKGEPIAIYGLWPLSLMQGRGAPWLLGTDELVRHAKPLMVIARATLKTWQRTYPHLENHVHSDNAVSIRWLQRLGFTVEAEVVHIGGQPLRRFWKGP